jgi:fructose-1,6-bisphosphatase I
MEMTEHLRLDSYLDRVAAHSPGLAPACQTVLAIADAGRNISKILARGRLAGALAELVGDSRDGDGQKALDVLTNDLLRDAMSISPVAVFASEESDEPEILDMHAKLAVAVDPLDGSSNIDTLAPVGTIFSIFHAAPVVAESFLQTGRHQLAAGFLIYGPQTALVLTMGDGVRFFTLDPECGAFVVTRDNILVPEKTREYAINASNVRHWEPQIRGYIVELLMGRTGPRGEDFNTRWLASMVADAYRILLRGGVYLYPGDQRRDYRHGRLRLVYEANPVAMLIEQAGGAATDGRQPILDLVPTAIHQRVPLVFGSADEVRRVAQAYETKTVTELPLFKSRGLFRKTMGGVESLA